MKKPLIGVPMGDPAGVGAEITVKSLMSDKVKDVADVIVVGDKEVLAQALKVCGLTAELNCVDDPADGRYEDGVINVIDLDNIDMASLQMGKVQAMCGKAAFEYIKKCVELAMAHKIDAIATTPINKEALRAAHVNYIGHTEILGALSHSRDPLTMFEVDGLRVFFLMRHMSLREACDAVKKDRVRSSLSSSRQSSSASSAASAISRSSPALPRGSAVRSAVSASSSASAS